MNNEQEILKERLQKWREAKKNSASGRVVAAANPKRPTLSLAPNRDQRIPKIDHVVGAALEKPPSKATKSFEKDEPVVKGKALVKATQEPKGNPCPRVASQRGKDDNSHSYARVLKPHGNIPKSSATVKNVMKRNTRRLSRNFTAANKVNQKTKGPSQPAGERGGRRQAELLKKRLEAWKAKKEVKPLKNRQNANIGTKSTTSVGKSRPNSYVASSKKLSAIIQSYVSSDKKDGENLKKTPTTKTPCKRKGAKRPLNFSTSEASAKKARLSVSKSVSRLASTPAASRNPPISVTTPRTPGNSLDEERRQLREKLQSWLKARGKTPERHRHTACFHRSQDKPWRSPVQLDSPGLDECQLARQKTVLDHEDIAREVKRHVGTCMEKYEEGTPAEDVLAELDRLVEKVHNSQTVSSYWLCKARLTEVLGNDARTVEVYDDALKSEAEPKMDILKALNDFTSRQLQHHEEARNEDEKQRPQTERKRTRRSVRILEAPLTMPRKMSRVQHQVDKENIINSSTVKYSVSSCTPLMKNLSLNDDDNSPTCYVLTPVRRSTRKSFTNLPKMLQDHDEVIDNVDDLSENKRRKTLYSENSSLHGRLDLDEEESDSGEN